MVRRMCWAISHSSSRREDFHKNPTRAGQKGEGEHNRDHTIEISCYRSGFFNASSGDLGGESLNVVWPKGT
jgi:hypothetical protein